MPYHHYVSAFHLAEFTASRTRTSNIWVVDLEQRKRWKRLVTRAGGQNTYNGPPVVYGESVEALIGRRYEAPAAPVLRRVNDDLSVPEGEDMDALLNYVALVSFNGPSRRGAMNDAQEQALCFMAQMMVAHPETFEAAQAKCRRDGVPLLGAMSYEELKTALESGHFSYMMAPSAHTQAIAEGVAELSRMLNTRIWSLLVAGPAVPDFVCSDAPVALVWTVDNAHRSPGLSPKDRWVPPPGFLSEDSEVTVPLGRRTCLVGTYGGASRVQTVGVSHVAEANRRATAQAARFVFSSEETFVLLDAAGTVCGSERLIA